MGSGLGEALRHSAWAYPLVEIFHIAGIVLLVGSVTVFDLRILGFGRQIPVRDLARHTLPWSIGALLLVVPSGLLLFLTDAQSVLQNPAFVLKLGLLALAGLNAAAFHLGPYQRVKAWEVGQTLPPAARLHAALSLGLWLGVIGCGRMIAYV
jgi:hypothetical protein